MSLVAGDLLNDARGLSLGLTLLTLGVGILLWLFGWWGHRFWTVLVVTVAAGVYGLSDVRAPDAPLLTALLLALAAGMLALALVRVLAFVAAGVTGVLFVQELMPSLHQPVLVFLIGGLVCLFLYRICLMALTSLAGAMLLLFAGLLLGQNHSPFDAALWADQNSALLNGACGLLALLGFAFQFYLHRRAHRRDGRDDGKGWGILRFGKPRSGDKPRRQAA